MTITLIKGRNPSYCGLQPKPKGHTIKRCTGCQIGRFRYKQAVREQMSGLSLPDPKRHPPLPEVRLAYPPSDVTLSP